VRSRPALAIAPIASLVAPAVLVLLAHALAPSPARAQSATADTTKAPPAPQPPADSATIAAAAPAAPLPRLPLPDRWKLRTGLSASLFYGNREQRILGTRSDLSRADSSVELRADLQMSYGEASTETEARQVFKRLWLGNLSADVRPYAIVSPFVFVTLESNLEKRLHGRYSAGLGARQTLVRTEKSEASLSVGLLGERLVPRLDATGAANDQSLTRWSLRGKLRQALGDRARVLHTTFWRPDARHGSEFLVQSQTDMEFKATTQLALTLSLLHNYDTEAMGRGARTNTDGQMLVGATATW
jgi:hypothetical protein